MKIADCTVTSGEVAKEVYSYGQNLAGYNPADITEYGCDTPGGDIRLQVHEGGWCVHTGDASYDQDHRGYWGCGFVPAGCTRKDARTIARDLIEAAGHHAQ
jgi:hypothetical protein